MQFEFLFPQLRPEPPNINVLAIGPKEVPLRLIRNTQARRYILRVKEDGSARVTIPRGGSAKRARDFARRNITWLEEQFKKRQQTNGHSSDWRHGTEILFRGKSEALFIWETDGGGMVDFADQIVPVSNSNGNLRQEIEQHLWRLAGSELVKRTHELADLHGLHPHRVTVRNQKSRWGSCSAGKTISLNWRLIQTPDFVRDYIILHELMHLREMNHSRRFWNLVKTACPDAGMAKAWLRQHQGLLR